jgi:hypothetical protein
MTTQFQKFAISTKKRKKIKLWEKDLAADAKDATLNKNLVLKKMKILTQKFFEKMKKEEWPKKVFPNFVLRLIYTLRFRMAISRNLDYNPGHFVF